MGVDAAYATVNAAVTARQAALAARVGTIEHKCNRKNTALAAINHEERFASEEIDKKSHSQEKYSRPGRTKALLGVAAIALAGQAIFGTSYIDSKEKAVHVRCLDFATEIIQEYAANHDTQLTDDEITSYQNMVCHK